MSKTSAVRSCSRIRKPISDSDRIQGHSTALARLTKPIPARITASTAITRDAMPAMPSTRLRNRVSPVVAHSRSRRSTLPSRNSNTPAATISRKCTTEVAPGPNSIGTRSMALLSDS